MKKFVLIIFLLMSLQDGWATSRFYIVRLNGVPVGSSEVTLRTDALGNLISETQNYITVRRGNDTIFMKEFSTQVESADLKPVSLSNIFQTSHFRESYSVVFDVVKGQGIYSAGDQQIVFPLSNYPYLNNKKQETFRKMIKSNIQLLKFNNFSPEVKKIVKSSLEYKGVFKSVKHENRKTAFKGIPEYYEFVLNENLENVILKTDYIVNREGVPQFISTHQMGIDFEYIMKGFDKTVMKETDNQVPDLLELTSVTPVHYFPSSYKVDQIEFEILFRDTFPQISMNTEYQREVYRHDKTIGLLIKRPVIVDDSVAGISKDYLKQTDMVQCNNPEIVEVADYIRKSSHSDVAFIEKTVDYVYNTIHKKNFSVDFSDAVSVLKHREGDCTEHSVLAIAILRAGKIPARAAIGLVSVNGVFAYHMWVEVLIDDKWIPVDPTFNQVSADPSHIRISHTSLDNVLMNRDFLPASYFINNVDIRPLKMKFDNGTVIDRFDMEVKDSNVCFYVADYCFEAAEPLKVISNKKDIPPIYFILKKDETHVKVEYFDLKYEGYSKFIIAGEALENSTISREIVNGKRLVSGQSGESLIIFIEIESVLFKFTFSNTSDTMDMERFKERVYDFCLKMVNRHT